MIIIDQINMNMPAGFETRARSITHYAAAALAKCTLSERIEDREFLYLPTLTLNPDQSDEFIGDAIANSIVTALKKGGNCHAS